jgi:hypothetical protein
MLNKVYLEFRDIYQNAQYVVLSSPSIEFSIGQRSTPLDQLLTEYQQSTACFITACNPWGKDLGKDMNHAKMAQLEKDLIKTGLPYLMAFGRNSEGTWKEESFLIIGIDKQEASQLGRQYEQNAIIWVVKEQVPELIWLI